MRPFIQEKYWGKKGINLKWYLTQSLESVLWCACWVIQEIFESSMKSICSHLGQCCLINSTNTLAFIKSGVKRPLFETVVQPDPKCHPWPCSLQLVVNVVEPEGILPKVLLMMRWFIYSFGSWGEKSDIGTLERRVQATKVVRGWGTCPVRGPEGRGVAQPGEEMASRAPDSGQPPWGGGRSLKRRSRPLWRGVWREERCNRHRLEKKRRSDSVGGRMLPGRTFDQQDGLPREVVLPRPGWMKLRDAWSGLTADPALSRGWDCGPPEALQPELSYNIHRYR